MIVPTAVALSLLTLSSALPFTPSSAASPSSELDLSVGSSRYPSFFSSSSSSDPRRRRRSLAVDLGDGEGGSGGGIVVLDLDSPIPDDGSLSDDSSFKTTDDESGDSEDVFDPSSASGGKVVKNPKVVPNPKNPNFSSSVAANAAPSATATAQSTMTTMTSSASSSTSTSTAKTFTGQATYFYQDGVAGACGNVNPDSAYIVALDYRLYGDLGKVSKYCGKSLTITNTDNGKSVVATVADACPTCESKYSLDLSEGAFGQIGLYDTGILPIEWYWN